MRIQLSPSCGPALINPVMGLVHTAQGARTDESLGNFCANPVNGVSYGYGIDDDSVTLMVPENQQSWSALGANRFAIHICLAGFAEWTRAQWLEHPVMLSQTSDLIREISTQSGWPIRHSTAAQIRAHEGGWAGHGDYSDATGDGDHWDPGPDFPWDVVLSDASTASTPATLEDEDMLLSFRNSDTGAIVTAGPGHWRQIESPAYYNLLLARGVCKPVVNVVGAEFTYFQNVFLASEFNDQALKVQLDKVAAAVTA